MTATEKKILIWVLVLSFLLAVSNLSPLGFSASPMAAKGQVVEEEKLVQEVATVYPLSDYYPLALTYIPEGASDIVVSGMIKELKNRAFDFYVFNKLNYERWKAGASYQVYVEVKSVTAYPLSISPTREDVNEGLRIVVSNIYLQEPKNTSLVDTTAKIYPYTNHSISFSMLPIMWGYTAEVTVKGSANEIHGYKFNLYALDSKNYDLWNTGRSYAAFYEVRGRESYDFSFIVPREKSVESFYFVLERLEPDVELDIDLSASGSWLAPAELAVEYDVKISWKEKPTGCLIATAAYGSELEPEVQFIRDFRDRAVASTVIGSSFLSIFNPFYYSFSPQVASFISAHHPVRELVKYSLYPFVGAVRVASWIYLVFAFNAELAVASALLTGSLLVGIVYFLPVEVVVKSALRRRHRNCIGQRDLMAIIPEESVYVKPIPVARANPMTLEDLRRVYQSKSKHIQQRLDELRAGWSKTDEGIFAELCYCILLARASAEATLPVLVGLEKDRLLFQGSKQEIEDYLRKNDYPLAKRSGYIVNWRCRFIDQGSLRIKSVLESGFKTLIGWNVQKMREYLVFQNNGVGWKAASQFLRNVGIGMGHGLAVLDRHIQRELKKFGYIPKVVPALNKSGYLEYERRIQSLSRDSGIPMDGLDLLIWSNRTGKIMK